MLKEALLTLVTAVLGAIATLIFTVGYLTVTGPLCLPGKLAPLVVAEFTLAVLAWRGGSR